jgi:putative metalloenzyme radical SAM/SPASM domain maturase
MLKPYDNALDRPFPSKLFLEVTTRCNLHCKMCVKQSGGNGIATGDLSESTFEMLKPAIACLDEVIISGVGEPLLHPRLEKFIYDIKTRLPSTGTVNIQTNGTLLTRRRIEALLSVDLDTICISVDAVTSDLLTSIRAGAQFGQLEKALAFLEKARTRSRCSVPSVGVQFVLMKDNLRHLPQVLQWAGRLGVDFAIVSHLLPFDADLSQQAVYPTTSDAAMAHFRQWKKNISRSGLRIEDYPAASLKYYKIRTADERKLIAMVDSMKAEGLRKDISLNLAQLMAPEDVWISQVDSVFEKAAAVAQAEGMDLILPARQPEHMRRCSFIEEGGVFVDWEGSVSPCHFTWHKYACYPGGRKKMVQPVCFGHLESAPLIEIWNRDEFKSFRKSVLQYDYPYCGDCGLSPCDYIDDQIFEHDCHTNTVPCCDCPWATGIHNCLQ